MISLLNRALSYFINKERTQFIYHNYRLLSYSASSEFSGITHNATAFIGCDDGKV